MHLLQQQNTCSRLDQRRRERNCQRNRQCYSTTCGLQWGIGFLTQVKDPDKDNWGKLKRVLKYLKCTIYFPLILAADSLSFIRWWVEASFIVHMDCKEQTGAIMKAT